MVGSPADGSKRLGLHEDRKGKREALEKRVRQVEEKVSEFADFISERGTALCEDFKKLEEGLGTCKVKREVLDDRKQKELQLVETNVLADLSSERETRKDSHRQLVRFIEEKAQLLRAGLVTERTAREESGNYGIHQVQQEILRLTDRVDQELVKVEQQETNISRKLEDESIRLESLIQNEREKRERMQNQMLQILEDLSVKHHMAIKTEKRARETTEELLVKLLESSLKTIERGF